MESTLAVPIEQLLAHRAWLKRLARGLVNDLQTADDLMQEVWVAAMERPPRKGHSLKGWLATVLRRKAIDRSRAESRRTQHEGSRRPGEGPTTSADALVAQTELNAKLTKAVLDLEEPYRSTLLLRYAGGNSIAEVARLQDVPIETVRTRLKRALARLRAHLDRTHGHDRSQWMAVLVPMVWPEAATAAATTASSTTATAAALVGVGGAVVGSKLTVVAGALVAIALSAWAVFELGSGPDVGTEGPSDTELAGVESGVTVDDVEAPALEGFGDGDPEPEPPAPIPTKPLSDAAQRGAEMRGPEVAEGRISGRITTKEGEVLEGVTIVVNHAHPEHSALADMLGGKKEGERTFPFTWGADPYGWFRIDDLPDGEYSLRVSAPGYAPRTVAAGAGGEHVRVSLEKAEPLAGRLVAADPSTPLAGIRLVARPEESPVIGPASVAVVDEDGAFVFDSLPRGRYVIRFSPAMSAGRDLLAVYEPIEVGPVPTGADPIEIPLRKGGVIAGTLVDENGDVVTRQVRVEALGLTDEDEKDYTRRYFVTSSAADGSFRIEGLKSGRYSLSFDPIVDKANPVLRGPRATLLDNVHSGTTELVVEMWPGIAVHGWLKDAEGNPVASMAGFVHVRPAGEAHGGQSAIVMNVDGEGHFITPPVDPLVRYDIHVGSYPGFMPRDVEGISPTEQGIVIELESASRITGRVVNDEGEPVVGTSVVAYALSKASPEDKGRHSFTYVDARGHFALEGLGEHEFKVTAGGASSGYVTADGGVMVKAGATDVVLKVKRGVRFSARLVDEHDRPIQSPYVNASDGVTAWFTRIAGDDGRFTFPGVPEGKIQIGARIDGTFVSLGEFEAPAEDVTIKVGVR